VFIKNPRCRTIAIDSSFAFEGHEHTLWYEALIGVEGVVGIQIQRESVRLVPGAFFLIPKGIFHLIWAERSPARYANLVFEGDGDLFAEIAGRGVLQLRPPERMAWRKWSDTASRAKRPIRAHGDEKLALEILDLFLKLSARTAAKGSPREAPTRPGGLSLKILERIGGMIDREPGRLHTREEIGKLFLLEKDYLSHKIRRLTGFTVMDLYFKAKLERAARELEKGKSVREVAERAGFANPFHFSRKFKQVVGLAPSQLARGR